MIRSIGARRSSLPEESRRRVSGNRASVYFPLFISRPISATGARSGSRGGPTRTPEEPRRVAGVFPSSVWVGSLLQLLIPIPSGLFLFNNSRFRGALPYQNICQLAPAVGIVPAANMFGT